jgi:hypothetical protein
VEGRFRMEKLFNKIEEWENYNEEIYNNQEKYIIIPLSEYNELKDKEIKFKELIKYIKENII